GRGVRGFLHVGDARVDVGGDGLRVEARRLQQLHVGPHNVRAVDVGGHGVDLVVQGQQLHEVAGERLGEPVLVVQVGDVLELAGVDVVGELETGVGLEG